MIADAQPAANFPDCLAFLRLVDILALPMSDKRAHARYEVEATVNIAAAGGRVQNISVGGICIQTPAVEEVGSVVDVVLRLPDLGETLALRGEVVWANRQPPEDVGIRWVNLGSDRRALLERYIHLVAAHAT